MKLSATMAAALSDTLEKGGELSRYQGGFWSVPGAAWQDVQRWHLGTSTVEALVKRGMLEYVEWKEGRSGKFPIAARITEAARAA